ncbi:MAG: SDR family NAD(P)-dependent oxidoreductase [Edaphobacter sp.]|uniref:SDR family NAD(P)-dependent oxidoreductase n=1 Tax=Edaphobacter sp. TaxID=1934404 RepID=UPI0023A2FCEE|nr:SDR family oxidoreductase [Edaphobacter sp.]MDE1177388.1 SDR family NAD(P)-dependent oxidoreductase [Edaphobacter sp.]
MPVAIITGAAQGIGHRTAQLLAANGFSLALIDLQPCPEIPGADVAQFTGDLTSDDFILSTVAAIQQRFGRIDTLVNNAGISFIAPAQTVSAADFRRVLEVNLVAPFLLSRAAGEVMLRQRQGSIVNIASIAGLSGIADRSAYNASKHGLIGLTRTLAAEWGASNVRVNAVCPGWVKTEMDHADQAASAYSDSDIIDRVPMARFATPDDIANAVHFLADPARSAFINGHTLTVDGGWTADASWQSLRLSHR